MQKKLFTVGPCEMFERSLAIGAQPVPYFRNQEFSDVMLECERLFKTFAGAKESDKFVLLTASGTGAMEAVVMNCLSASQDRALVVVGGSFGARFSHICDRHKIEHTDIVLGEGEVLSKSHFERYEDAGYTALLVNLDETSTGQLYDIDMLSSFCKRNNLFFVVDAISAFASDPIHFTEAGIGALIVSSQKALSIAPGLSFVVLSEEGYESRVTIHDPGCMYFDFVDYVNNGARGQTPFTPAVGTVLQLQDILRKIEEDGGVDSWIVRTAEIARDFRKRVVELPISIPDYPLSNAVTPIIFASADASEVNKRLVEEYGYVLNPCGGSNAAKMSRVAHIGNHTIEDNIELINALRAILCD